MSRLIVCVPGLSGTRSRWKPLVDKLLTEEPLRGSTVRYFNQRYGVLSTDDAEELAKRLKDWMKTWWEEEKEHNRNQYDDIIILAHGAGALLARYAFLLALGNNKENKPTQEWTRSVSRIVFFAGLNGGLCPTLDDNGKKGRLRRWLIRRAAELAADSPKHFLVEDLLAGSDFVAKMRILWIQRFSELTPRPAVVQVRGSEDRLVAEDDGNELHKSWTAKEVEVSGADHDSVLDIESDDDSRPPSYPEIRDAILDKYSGERQLIDDGTPQTVIFLVHGIRDSNRTWVEEAKMLLRDALKGSQIVTPTYGYFSALDFALPMVRKRRTRWFKEQYTKNLAKYPDGVFHFVGHSNGTYLLGQSLKDIRYMSFNKVVLAGSVLPNDFNWENKLGTQVKQVWNHRAQFDVPVAVLCAALRFVFMSDIGTAGYEGFHADGIHECAYHKGGHKKIVSSSYLPLMLRALTDPNYSEQCSPRVGEVSWFSRISRMSRWLFWITLALVLAISDEVGLLVDHWRHWPFPEGFVSILLLFVLVVIWILDWY